MKRFFFVFVALIMCVVSVFASDGSDTVLPDILDGFASFVGISRW